MSVLSSLFKPLAYLSLPMFILHKLSNSSPLVRYYVRIGLFLSTLSFCSVWGMLCAVGMPLLGMRFDVHWVVARTFYALTSRALDIKMTVEGEEYLNTRPAILVGNHQSMLDILLLGRIMPRRSTIMGKKELRFTPLLGQYMLLAGSIFVDRGNSVKAVESLKAAGETMKERNSALWMFPEGTRSMRPHHDMLPFKKGAFHIAVQAGVPIVPVICENYWRLYRKGVFESGTLKVKVLPPIPTTGLTADDVASLSIRVHDAMVEALREISERGPSPAAAGKAALSANPPAIAPARTEEKRDTPPPAISQPAVTPLASPESRSVSRASTYASEDLSSPAMSRRGGSENGMETEEDEGMVLVGRPNP